MNNKGNLEDHLSMIEGKAKTAYQTILHIAKDKHFKRIQMVIWKLLETCIIIPIITYRAKTRKFKKFILLPKTTYMVQAKYYKYHKGAV